MTNRNAKIAGLLLFLGAIQFTIATLLAGALYPNYSASNNYISDLGVWSQPSAAIFNPSIIVSGVTSLISAYLIRRQFRSRLLPIFLALAGVGSMLVGVFPENTILVNSIPIVHSIGAFMAFIFGAAAATAAYKVTKPPFSYVSVALGIMTLMAFVLLLTTGGSGFLGLGAGTIERLVAYPSLFWTLGFAGYLLGMESWDG